MCLKIFVKNQESSSKIPPKKLKDILVSLTAVCLHFRIEWYREPLSIHHEDNSGDLIELRQRVYVYRHHSGISKPEGHWVNRARHIYDTKKHIMRVRILIISAIITLDMKQFKITCINGKPS